jgi:Mg2+/Co2+ transporter CorB
MESEYGRKGSMVKYLSKRPDILLTTILIVNNLVNIAASALVSNMTIRIFGSQALAISTGLLTLVILIFAEVTPKQIAIVHNEKIALSMAYPVKWVSLILLPVIKMIGFFSSLQEARIIREHRSAVAKQVFHDLFAATVTLGKRVKPHADIVIDLPGGCNWSDLSAALFYDLVANLD